MTAHLPLLQHSIATAPALGALILTFGPVSGAHVNIHALLADLGEPLDQPDDPDTQDCS